MNTCDHYSYVKTKAYAESLKETCVLRFLQLIPRPGFKNMHKMFATVKKGLTAKI